MINKDEKIILYGCGKHCMSLLENYLLPVNNIAMIVDGDTNNVGKVIFGNVICSPREMEQCNTHIVVIGSKIYFEEIKLAVMKINASFDVILIDDYIINYPKADTVTSYLAKRSREEIESLIGKMKKIGQLPAGAFENALLFADRNAMLRLVPKNGVVAEIGVAYG